ncbi:MAG TPA: SRPBCC family protein [Solimonas sp.]|nr:SRPBCC family protein [Solimonas sp.]
MTVLQHTITLPVPPARAYEYATTPASWPQWHPSSLKVAPGAEYPLPTGARFEEDIRAGGRRTHLSWTVLEAEPSRRWRASAVASNGVTLTLEYRFEAEESQTRFIRTLDYRLPNAVLRLYNQLLGRWLIERESADSLQRLRAMLAR